MLKTEGVGEERIDADDVRIRFPIGDALDGDSVLDVGNIFVGERVRGKSFVGDRVGEELSDVFASWPTSMTADEGRAKSRDNGDEVSLPLPLIM